MRTLTAFLLVALLALAGCGGDDGEESPAQGSGAPAETATEEPTREEPAAEEPAGGDEGTTIELASSDFGEILWGPDRQAIYIFEKDPEGESACYGDCAEAWPPVYTEGEPEAGKGVDESLLGTTERRDGRLQVTYAGKPLYYYAHEGAGEVRCHNVNLNGGFWWVVGADGKRRP